MDQPFVVGSLSTPIGPVPQISPSLSRPDRLGSYKARWGIRRMHYTVDPGLYALGTPDANSPVLVTANYKMTFDRLREAVAGWNLWILVLDTRGINVWCAAGKGTFSTDELVKRIKASGLVRVVTHRKIILPQLSGPGVSAHWVKQLSGFRVTYGPIRAVDLSAFLKNGLKAPPEMRLKTFTFIERLVLTPMEIVGAGKVALYILPLLFLLGGLGGPGPFWANALDYGLFAIAAIVSAIFTGAVLAPVFLPWIPGRAFALKGVWTGLLAVILLAFWRAGHPVAWFGSLELWAWLLIILAVSAYLSMNFTGASTYTSLSGVKKEMRYALPLEIGAGALGLLLWLLSRFLA